VGRAGAILLRRGYERKGWRENIFDREVDRQEFFKTVANACQSLV
jgi:hypothetical protein